MLLIASILIFICTCSIMVFLRKRRFKKGTNRLRFNANFRYELFIYVTEIAFIFMLFQLVLMFYAKPLGYEGEGFLKRFIDMFTVYQIFIVVVLKLYDSLKQDAYSTLLYSIDLATPLLDENKPIHEDVWEGRNVYGDEKVFFPAELLSAVNGFYTLLELYEEHRLSDSEESKELVNEIRHKVNMIKSKFGLANNELGFHWNTSLFLRLGKSFKDKNEDIEQAPPTE